jgi:hypothetical protein
MLAMNWLLLGIVFFTVGGVGVFVLWRVRHRSPVDNPATWPETDATIHSVGTVIMNAGKYSYTLNVGDFSYVVNDDYYSGRATISRSSFAGDIKPNDIVNKKFRVRYNPRNSEKYDLSQSDVGGLLLDQYNNSGTDVDPIDLNIDKI